MMQIFKKIMSNAENAKMMMKMIHGDGMDCRMKMKKDDQ
jgi:hypothetical protein